MVETMESKEPKHKVYTKADCVFVGEVYDELLDEDVQNQLRCKVVFNSTALHKALIQNPKILIFRCFEDQNKNNQIVQDIVMNSPKSKILVIGKSKEDFKKTIAKEIDLFVEDADFDLFKISLEQLSFDHKYSENFSDESITLRHINPKITSVFFYGLGFTLLSLLIGILLIA
jgi:hypothetical protein